MGPEHAGEPEERRAGVRRRAARHAARSLDEPPGGVEGAEERLERRRLDGQRPRREDREARLPVVEEPLDDDEPDARRGALEVVGLALELRDPLPELGRVPFEREEPFGLKDLKLNGNDLMQSGVPGGPELGRILHILLERVLDDPELNDRERLEAMAADLVNGKDPGTTPDSSDETDPLDTE